MENKTYTTYAAIGNNGHQVIAKKDNPNEHIQIENQSDIDDLIDVLESLKTCKVPIEEYLDLAAYNWEKEFEFTKGNARFVVFREFDPSGYKGALDVLYEENGNIYNSNGDLVTKGGKPVVEGYQNKK